MSSCGVSWRIWNN
uniref:Uncharacterized protein n=1 Tax=Arundo donax TaxID=35708 RepID=A0A0A9BS49_ARUDO